MIIDKIDVYLVRLPLAQPFVIADTTIEEVETVYLRLEGEGYTGWSEITPGNRPYITDSWSEGVFQTIKKVHLPMVAEKGYLSSGEDLDMLFAPIKGNRQAQAAFDLALWDLIAKKNEEPLWKTLGGAKKTIEVGVTFDRNEDQDAFYKDFFRVVNEHYRRVTLKLRPGWDIQVVGAVRAEAPPFMSLQIDVEGALDMDSHSEILSRLEDFLPALIEQPFPAEEYVGLAMYQEMTRTSIALDESISTFREANIALDLQSGRLFCLKPGRVGGHTEAIKINNEAARHDVNCYGGFDLQSSIGYRHLLSLASLPNFTLPCDYIRFDEIFTEEPGKPVLSAEFTDESKKDAEDPNRALYRGVELWEEPGIGCEPDQAIIEKYLVEHASWSRK